MSNCFTYSGRVKDRQGLADLLNELGLVGEGVEVGVWRGDFSDWFLDQWRGRRLYLVDPWAKLDDYDDVRNQDYDPADYLHVRQRFERHGDRARVVRATSLHAAAELPDGLDFVYVDANHAYDHVLADLNLWWPKLRPGGVLAGHDVMSLSHPGVTAALAEFCAARGVAADLVAGDYRNNVLVNAHSYYVVKPA